MCSEKRPDDSPTLPITENAADSEVSDVEDRGYCDHSRSDPELRMRLKNVGKRKIQTLYNNTDMVSNLRYTKQFLLMFNI